MDVTAEVTPHHLLLTEELARGYDARFKVNPPLRRDEDVQALREGLADGTIDIVATDHAPHPVEAKECEWGEAANGMVGLETALRVVQAAWSTRGSCRGPTSHESCRAARRHRPARGSRHAARRRAAPRTSRSTTRQRAANSRVERPARQGRQLALPGPDLPGRVVATLHDGYATVLDGELVDADVVAASAVRHG